MRFYYLSFASALLLAFIYQSGTVALWWLWMRLHWRRHRVGRWMVPAFVLLYALPLAEELWIAWKFERLCGSAPRWITSDSGAWDKEKAGTPSANSSVAYKIEAWTSDVRLSSSGSSAVVSYVRRPPWFQLDPDAPLLACDASPM